MKFPKIFLLAPSGCSPFLELLHGGAAAKIAGGYGCATSMRLQKQKKYSRACPAGTRVTLQVGCLLSKPEGKVDFSCNSATTNGRFRRPKTLIKKTWSRSFRSVANTVGCHVRMAPRIAGENKRYYSRHPGTLRISRVHTSRKVTFPLLSRPAWTLALKGWASKEGPEAHMNAYLREVCKKNRERLDTTSKR